MKQRRHNYKVFLGIATHAFTVALLMSITDMITPTHQVLTGIAFLLIALGNFVFE